MKQSQQGYVLITVLIALVLLAVVAARLDRRVEEFRDAQGNWQRWAASQAALSSARDELLFAMSTLPLSQWGFGRGAGALRVDGRPYRLDSGVLVSVQDSRGLISISSPDMPVMRNYLLANGIADREIEPLLDKLVDYADIDPLRRLNGAEKEDYEDAGLPPPRDDWPISAYEIRLVMGWASKPRLWLRAGDVFTASREGWINPNTAPAAVLAALPGASPAGVAAVLALREQRLFTSSAELLSVAGILVPDDPVSFHPGRYYRLRVWQEDGPGAMEYNVILTPAAPKLPWLILEARLVDRPGKELAAARVAAFPLPLAAAADAGR